MEDSNKGIIEEEGTFSTFYDFGKHLNSKYLLVISIKGLVISRAPLSLVNVKTLLRGQLFRHSCPILKRRDAIDDIQDAGYKEFYVLKLLRTITDGKVVYLV